VLLQLLESGIIIVRRHNHPILLSDVIYCLGIASLPFGTTRQYYYNT